MSQEIPLTQDCSEEDSSHATSRQDTNNGTAESPSGSGLRKRKHPSSLELDDHPPPNKLLPTSSEQEAMRQKQFLYQAAAEAERNPFYLQPHQHPMLPFFSLNPAVKPGGFSPVYSLLPTTSKPPNQPPLGATSAISLSGSTTMLQSASSIPPTPSGTVASSPRPTYPAQFYPAFMKYPFSPPAGLLSPWNAGGLASANGARSLGGVVAPLPLGSPGCMQVQNSNCVLAASTPRETNRTGVSRSQGSSGLTSEASAEQPLQQQQQKVAWPQSPQTLFATPSSGVQRQVMSPRSNIESLQSSLNYLHPSPLSPMMLALSPYNNSVSSCPTFSGSNGLSDRGSKRYAPSEYHVGPQRPLHERYCGTDGKTDGGNNSGRNTPNYSSSDDSGNNLAITGDMGLAQTSVSGGPHSPLSRVVLVQSEDREKATVEGSGLGQVSGSLYSSHGPLSNSQPLSVGSSSQAYLSGYPPTGSVERPSSGVSSMSSSYSSRDTTPELDDHEDGHKLEPHHPFGGESDVFCMVPGRLSLLSSTQKYRVTVDEVRRRLMHPECLNASVLGGILRRAKSKNGGHVLRQRLQSIGVTLPPGRRKAAELSLLTSLVEGEAHHLSSDFQRLCEKSFPHSELAQIIARQHTGTPQAQNRISMVKATQMIVSELQAMLNAVGGPSNIRPNDPNNPYPGLTNFSLLGHGFGNPAINSGLTVLQTYLQELLAFYEGRKPIQLNTSFPFAENPPTPCLDSYQKPPGPCVQGDRSPLHTAALQSPAELLNKQSGMNMKLENPESPNHST